MAVLIRTEQPGDEPGIELVTTRAFDGSIVAGLVTLLRDHWPGYDRGLSVVALADGRLVGHVLGLSYRARLRGQWQQAMAIGPVCVDPEYQRQGIGRQMMRACQDLGRAAGCQFALIEGVPSYYPQFGYVPAWGFANITVDRDRLPSADELPPLVATPVAPADLPWLRERLEEELDQVDFGLAWPEALAAWSLPGCNVAVWRTGDGARAAYTLNRPVGPFDAIQGLFCLADEPTLAMAALARLRPASLNHHPAGWLAQTVLDPGWAKVGEPELAPWCLANELVPGALTAYLAEVHACQRAPGLANWPLPFWLG